MGKEIRVLYSDSADLINMSKTKLANLFLIDVLIAGNVIPLVFDTGATISVLSESAAYSVGAIPLSSKVRGGGNAGTIKSASKSEIPALKIGGNSVEDVGVVVLPDKQLEFGIDEEENDLKVNGFLGWDVISKFKWILDPINRTYTIEEPEWHSNKGKLHWDNMPIIEAQYDNQHLYFGFDTGNTESMFSKEFIPFLEDKRERVDDMVGVDGEKEEGVYVISDIELQVSSNKIELKDISVLKRDIFPTKKYIVTGLLAADIIQRHKCVIDWISQDFRLI